MPARSTGQLAAKPVFMSRRLYRTGETPEQGAARELFEETGVRASKVGQYLFCQPWPYPSSLMFGMILEAETEELTLDLNEIAEAVWLSRDEVKAVLRRT